MTSKKAILLAAALLSIPPILHGASDVSVLKGISKGGTFSGSNPIVFKPTKPRATASKGTVKGAINGGKRITIKTASNASGNGDLVFGEGIVKTKGKTATLRLEAVRDIAVNATIGSIKNGVAVELNAGRGISSSAPIGTNGANVAIDTVEPFVLGAPLNTGVGHVLLQSGSLISNINMTVTAGAVEVFPGASWRLHGTVVGDLSVGGSVAPGPLGINALTVRGAVAFQSGASFIVNLGGVSKGGNYGSLTAEGPVTVDGNLIIDCVNGFEDQIVKGQTFTILSGSSITGTFTGLPNGSRVFLPDELGSLKITYNATSVVLNDWEPVLIDQTWDPGEVDDGTFVYTNARPRGHRHYFRVHAQETDIGAWRSRLNPAIGAEADLYMTRGLLPTRSSSQKRSTNVGSDGFVLNANEFDAGEEWFVLVYADPGTPWKFLTGRAYVQDLGTLQWTDTNASGTYDIGEPVIPSTTGDVEIKGEGMRFFKAGLPVGTPAWSLWLSGSDKDIAVRKSVVPFHNVASLYDRKQSGQMLVVPPFLGSGFSTYFVSVVGSPGESVNLDSRIQEVTDFSFNSTVSNVSVTDAPYRVYRVQVPVDEIAWDVSTQSLTGDPNIAVRRDSVPAEFDNDAFSEVPGNVSDSITLVPQFLTNGTWFVTVYGKGSYSFNLQNGPPTISPLQFTDQKTNDQTNRAGWRFYGLTDIQTQLGVLGWELKLAEQVPGTEIAVRRNAVPSRWRARKNGQPSVINSNAVDFAGVGSLQRPGHQADIWYVGVYMPTQELGSFKLSCAPIQPPTVAFDGGTQMITDIGPGQLSYVRVDVPPGVIGWDVRIRDVVGGNPGIAVRRDQLPALNSSNQLVNLGAWNPPASLVWPTGCQWAGGLDWTGYTLNGPSMPPGNRLVMGMGRPLEPGTYYVGIYNGSTTTITSCVVDSRGVGPGQTYPVTPVAYAGGTAPYTDLAPREPKYFKVSIPAGSPSWELLLNTSAGEAEMVVRLGTIPDFTATFGGDIHVSASGSEIEMMKVGPERYVLFPAAGSDVIPEGDYYVAVVSEGLAPSGLTIGTGTSSGNLTSVGPLLVTQLGLASPNPPQHPVDIVAGQIVAYQFDVPDDTYSLEVRLDERVNAPAMAVIQGTLFPKAVSSYGADGGIQVDPAPPGDADSLIYTISNPPAGRWTIVLNAGTTSGATAKLSVKALGVTPVAFDGGTSQVTGHAPGTVRYYVVNVPAGATGWDVRMRDLTGPTPIMLVRRDYVTGPPDEVTPGWQYWTFSQWPTAYQAKADVDWTNYHLNSTGVFVPPRLVTGMGRPLQPGKYYVGVINTSTTTAIDYTIDSRGIGVGMSYPVTTLDYATGDATITDLAPREARYFKVTIPANTTSWEVTLSVDAGELELLAREGAIPDFAAQTTGMIYRQSPEGCEIEMKKAGPERFVLMPPFGADYIPPGDYYLAVVSEGNAPNSTGGIIGTGTSSGLLKSRPLAVQDLGTANAVGTATPISTPEAPLVGAQVKAYKVMVPAGTDSLEVRLDNVIGNPWISLVQGTRNPTAAGETIPGLPPIGSTPHNEYGFDGGNRGLTNTRIITYPNPAAGEWRILVRAGHGAGPTFPFNDASGNLVVTALTTIPLNYDGGTFTVDGHQPGTWRYFVVEVPAGVEGWDIRLRDVPGAIPAMMVRRDALPLVPPSLIPGNEPASWQPWTATSWPTLNQWLGRVDWTDYALNGPGEPVPPRLVAGMGRPLQAGTYYVGVYNNTLNPTSYTVDSRGIGDGRTYPITPLAFAGGSATITDLPRREARYYKVSIPAGTPSWEVTLESTVGDVELLARSGAIPDFHAVREGNLYNITTGVEVEMKKAGPERYVLLPNANQSTLAAGDYYLAVVSEGVNPTATTAGTGSSSGLITSVGTLAVTDLGSVSPSGIGGPVTLAGGQMKAYQFEVPEGSDSIELRLDNAVGYPLMSIVQGTRLPIPPGYGPLGTAPHSDYGSDGGTGGTQVASIHTIPKPTPGQWSVLVRARHDANVTNPAAVFFPDASANLVVRSKPNTPLNFAEALNSGGGTHTDTRQAIDGEYNVYQVTVPPTISGEPVLGWIINTEVFQGAVSLEVYKDPANPAGGITIPIGVAVVVPPFLTFNETWYVRVKATGLTNYRITSRQVTLERPAWQMPSPHNQIFGDSGTAVNGDPLPGDRGVDLQQGSWHFYAIDVPADNSGLLRTELQAISGNPDLYLREDGVPTVNHLSGGKSGTTLIPRGLTGATTSYGNWVPFDGKTASRLRPGRWYVGVRAGGNSNVRYRLITSTGSVTDMALNPATATAQVPNFITEHSLADNDWKYYRFVVPEIAPQGWTLNFSQQVGDVVMWIRDTVPPGQKDANTKSANNIADWSSDRKNQGPYSGVYNLGNAVLPPFDDPGSYSVTTPPLRPGAVYYVGLRSNNSATFSLNSDTTAQSINPSTSLDFYTGTVTTTVPAGGTVRYKVPVPAEGTQFKYTSTHSASVQVRIEQGTIPSDSGTQHHVSSVANSSLNKDIAASPWPWVADQTYYVRFVNPAATDQPITFTLNGKNALTEDEDNPPDGLPDAWEMQYFGNLSQTASGDFDNDGSSNLSEYQNGTLPNDANSAKYALTLVTRNGTATATPDLPQYDKGTAVSLSNMAAAGHTFVGWSGGAFRADDFALKATGMITIPTGGNWTFGVNAADGFRLLVNGTQVISDNTLHEAADRFGQINLSAGTYAVELTAFERRGGEGLELFAALGSFTAFNTDFRLVGDVANGGIAVQTTVNGTSTPGFTVRQVESLTNAINNLGDADNLVNGTYAKRQEVTGVIDVLNFLTYDLSEGHFVDNAYFPLNAALEDLPLTLTMNRNYTIFALNSIALGAAVDAESLTWRTGSNAPWIGSIDPASFDTVDCVSSGPIGDNESSTLQTVVTGPGTLTFKWKVSSQPSADTLTFVDNGVTRATISGEVAWTASQTFSISAGAHTLTWTYSKNGTVSTGTDRAWVDQIVFTPQ